MTAKRGRPVQQGLAQARREQIVDAACAVFTDRGYEAATMADLAAHAGVGQGTVYRYFSSKRDILDHVFDRSVEQILGAVDVERLVEPPTNTEEFVALLGSLGSNLSELVRRSPHLITLVLVDGAAVDDELSARVVGLQAMVSSALAAVVEAGQRSGWIRPDVDPATSATVILSLTMPALLRSLTGSEPVQDTHYTTQLVDIVARGLCVP